MVVLDATIVNVALPHVQRALGFSGTGLEWVVNAYAITFGGLLLLGGRAGDILAGGGCSSSGWLPVLPRRPCSAGSPPAKMWLLTREGGTGRRRRGDRADRAGADHHQLPRRRGTRPSVWRLRGDGQHGSAVGLLLGGILTTYASWRWCFFVNVPIGILVAAAAPRVLAEIAPRPGRIDWAGAVTGCGGVALLVYGLSKAATGADGVSHWGDAQVVASLATSVVLLVSFVLIEMRSSRPLLPMRVLATATGRAPTW